MTKAPPPPAFTALGRREAQDRAALARDLSLGRRRKLQERRKELLRQAWPIVPQASGTPSD